MVDFIAGSAAGWIFAGYVIVWQRRRQRALPCYECRAMGRNCSLHVGSPRD